MGKNRSDKGATGFDEFYQKIYGERWPLLKSALLEEKSYVAYLNPYFSGEVDLGESKPFFSFPNCHEKLRWNPPIKDKNELNNYYLMDGASVLAPFYLDVIPGQKVLDLCAAPGGKSLILAYALKGEGSLTSNDRSNDRRGRLRRNLKDYLPSEVLELTQVTGHDASKWCLFEKDMYDKILLDAPCSSEGHVLQSPSHLEKWSVKRSKKLAALQWSMVASSLDVLKVGGEMVYSTCALSPFENDDVIEKLLTKREGRVELIQLELPIGEKTKYGYQILPDVHGHGPFYLAKLRRLS